MIRFSRLRNHRGEELPPLTQQLAAFRYVPRFLALVWRTQPVYGTVIVLVRVLRSLGPIALLWVGKLIVDEVIANVGAADPDWAYLVRLVALEFGIALVMEVLARGSSLLEGLIGDLVGNRMTVHLMEHAATLDLEQFESPRFYDSLQRAHQQSSGRVALLSTLFGIGQTLLTLASLTAALVAYNVWLLILVVAAVIPSFLGETHHAAHSYSLFFRWTPQRRELEYLRYLASSTATAKEVQLFGLSDYFIRRYRRLADEYYAMNRGLVVRRAVTGAVLTGLSMLAYYGALGFIVFQAVGAAISIGTMTFLIGSFDRARALVSGALLQGARIYEESLFLHDLYSFLDLRPRQARPRDPKPLPAPIREGFVFEDVGFRYPDTETWAVRNVSFRLAPGERLALVGENGAGKTTLVKLLTRLYDPSEGRVLLDGVDLREYDAVELRSQIGVIFQDFVCYDMTARENVAVGRIEEARDHDRITDAARKSLALGVVQRLRGGFDQMLGRRFDGGANLSGGEWQKIALARAYMRDASLLVLDEPTAALDARAEYEVFERFSDLTRGKMAVLISHRFSTVRMADRILVLDGGRVIEEGSHEELNLMGGRYAELFSLQAAGYR
ncbi:MAG TPA: ABC transporter ATP-binding protein [Longimicrobiaceae bacterium]|nr:ABC transporter ATP-binding protein [Longimicrobiaceae bacterium]